MGHVDPLGPHFDHPRVFQHSPGRCTTRWFLLKTAKRVSYKCLPSFKNALREEIEKKGNRHLPTLDEILEVITPLDSIFWFILQLGNRLTHNICQQVNQPSPWLHFCAICREREAMLGHFQQRYTGAPNVRGNGVALSRNSFRSHVIARSDERICIAFCAELARDTEITQLDLAVAA